MNIHIFIPILCAGNVANSATKIDYHWYNVTTIHLLVDTTNKIYII